MNCKEDDLAIIVRSQGGNRDKIVRCIELWPCVRGENRDGSLEVGPAWVVDRQLTSWDGSVGNLIFDSQLRPLRNPGPDEVDETLMWEPAAHG